MLEKIKNFIQSAVVTSSALVVDGVGGKVTVKRLQYFLDQKQDGWISGQTASLKKYRPAMTAVQNGKGGSATVKAMQKWLGISQDGQWGAQTSKALQKKLGVTQDGVFGKASVKALQKYLNSHDKANPKPSPSPTPSDPLQPWYDAVKTQYEWSKNQTYKWVNPPTVANSKTKGTCISLPAVALQRLGLLPKGGWFYLDLNTGKINGASASYVKSHTGTFSVSYPNKTIAQLGSNIKKGDIVAYKGGSGHIMIYWGKNKDGKPLFATMGNKKYHPIGVGIQVPGYANMKINMLVRIKKVA